MPRDRRLVGDEAEILIFPECCSTRNLSFLSPSSNDEEPGLDGGQTSGLLICLLQRAVLLEVVPEPSESAAVSDHDAKKVATMAYMASISRGTEETMCQHACRIRPNKR